jgi:type IV secretion system protein VirD4
MISKLKLYFKWGIKFGKPFMLPDKATRAVTYMERDELMREVAVKYPQPKKTIPIPVDNSYEPQEMPEEHKKVNLKTEKRS